MSEPAKKSDLGTRTLSAIVMVAIAGAALWLGGVWFTALAIAIGLGLVWEWVRLARKLPDGTGFKVGMVLFGIVYVALAVFALTDIHFALEFKGTLAIMALVWATDIGAYFTGRALGGPKIAPAISPSKTWSGLGGGMVAAMAVFWLAQSQGWMQAQRVEYPDVLQQASPLLGALVAVVAQAGDFLESWVKRRAGVKDSGSLIPGHGGLFDRLDGLLPVLILFGVVLVFGMR